MKRFEVSVFHIDEQDEERVEELNVPRTHIFSGVVDAPDAKYAAARAWMDSVGVQRRAFLDRVEAPNIIREWENDPELIADTLVSTSTELDGLGFLLDLTAEAWLISVNEVEPKS